MTTKRFAILGASGYVGRYFQSLLARERIPYVAISRSDIQDWSRLRRTLADAEIKALINCAGFTGKPNVDACEYQKADCLQGNGVLPGIVRAACESLDIPWGHVSSGCVFTGRRPDGNGFTEEDTPNFTFRQNNCSFYSGTKALGEEMLIDAPKCYVWRLRIPFENTANHRNYLQKLMSYKTLLQAENSLSQLEEFVQACLDCFRMELPYGIYNLTNPGSVWTSDVTDLIRASGISDKSFKFFDDESQFMKLAAKAPRSNCVLDSSKAIRAGLRLTPVIQSIEQTLARWETGSDLLATK